MKNLLAIAALLACMSGVSNAQTQLVFEDFDGTTVGDPFEVSFVDPGTEADDYFRVGTGLSQENTALTGATGNYFGGRDIDGH